MAISHDEQWAKEADEATARRLANNIPWDLDVETALCKGLKKLGLIEETPKIPVSFDVV